MKIQIDTPIDVHKQLRILQAVGEFKTIANAAEYVIAYNLGELVSKEARTLRREILKQKKDPKALTYDSEDVDSKKTKRRKEQ